MTQPRLPIPPRIPPSNHDASAGGADWLIVAIPLIALLVYLLSEAAS